MLERDTNGRFVGVEKPATYSVRESIVRYVVSRKVLSLAVAGGVGILAALGWGVQNIDRQSPSYLKLVSMVSGNECAIPKMLYETSWDMSEADPSQVEQRRLIKITECNGSEAHGGYSYLGSPGKGKVDVVIRDSGIGIRYADEKEKGLGLGFIVVRPASKTDQKYGWLATGTEFGEQCSCAQYMLPGPFTNVPVVITSDGQIPPKLREAAMKAGLKAQNEPGLSFFPEDWMTAVTASR